MDLTKLKLANFRNYAEFSQDLHPLTIITGPNGIGKTNIIEAILLSSTTRSHRTNHDRDLITWQKDYARVELNLKTATEKLKIATFLTTTPTFSKSYSLNGNTKKASEIVGIFQTVLFSPESLDLVYGPPGLRRRFLDIILCQSDRHYLRTLNQYNKVVRERNQLLFYINRGDSKVDELDFWDQQLVNFGSVIIENRHTLAQFLNHSISNFYESVSGTQDKVKISYKSSIQPEKFLTTLYNERSKEIKYTSTLFGPHRDDLIFSLNDHPLDANGSRGECRSFILAVKLAEIDYLTQQSAQSPVLLLDDVFSELDQNRRHRLTEIIKDHQTVITTTELDHIDDKIKKTAKIINLSQKD